jgi:hypothetical protein
MSNLIFVLYEEQKRQDKVARPSNELSGSPKVESFFCLVTDVTEITHPEDKEGLAIVLVSIDEHVIEGFKTVSIGPFQLIAFLEIMPSIITTKIL